LDAAIVADDADRTGARCQSEVLRYTGDLFYAIWREALTAKRNVLRGTSRLAGSGSVASSVDLAVELTAAVHADGRGAIARAAGRLSDRVTQRCTGTLTSIGGMFPGACSTATTLAELAACAQAQARGRFF